MTITILSNETKTASGTFTVPDTCTFIMAFVEDNVTPPIINGVDMQTVATIDETEQTKACGIFKYTVDSVYMNMTLPFTLFGTSVEFVYFTTATETKKGVLFGTGDGTYTADLATATDELVMGIALGSIGPVAMTGDTVAFTYLATSDKKKVGHLTPSDTSLTCVATDSGVSTGYYVTKATWVPQTLVSAGYWSYDPVKHVVTYSFAYTDGTFDYYYEYIDGVKLQGYEDKRLHGLSGPSGFVYYTYPGVWHPPVYTGGYYTYKKTWIEAGGNGQVSACFCSVQETGTSSFVSRPLIF